MKIFRNGKHIIQIKSKEDMENWSPEMPLIFIGFIRDKRLEVYPKKIRGKIDAYLDEILTDVGIPKLIAALKSKDLEQRKLVAKNLENIAKKNIDMLKIALPHIQEATKDPSKPIATIMKGIVKKFGQAQKRKATAKKREKLKILRTKMDKIDMDFAAGTISDANYIKEQKIYLKLKKEIQDAEE